MRCSVTKIWTENTLKGMPIYPRALELAKYELRFRPTSKRIKESINSLKREYRKFVKNKKFSTEQDLVNAFDQFLVERKKELFVK